MAAHDLETPRPPESIYRARRDEVEVTRPVFTGDVFDVGGELHMVLEHPCALRTDGVQLKPGILCAPVKVVETLRSDWSAASYRIMPLPALLGDQTKYAAHFDLAATLPSELLDVHRRVATLSQFGVNLLMQRLVHHLTRTVVLTNTLNAAIIAEYEEADLLSEWLSELGAPADGPAASDFHGWIRSPLVEEQPMTRQEALQDAQRRSEVRRQLRAEVRQRLRAE